VLAFFGPHDVKATTHDRAVVTLLGNGESGKIVPEWDSATALRRRTAVPICREQDGSMLEATAVIAIVLLVAREFAALGSGAWELRAAHLLGWVATPFLLAFAALFTLHVLGYIANR
jgi:hypothetical protein